MRRTLNRLSRVLVAGGLLTGVGTAQAEMSVSANVALATDYVFRYVSQTSEEPAISGGFDLDTGTGIYLGTWASNVDFGDDATIEVDGEELIIMGESEIYAVVE